jgi:hypothetical protein
VRPKTGPNVVVYFDANMPDIRECHRGCTSRATYFCKHRFGPGISLVSKPGWLIFTRLSDLQVILDFLYTISHYFRKLRGHRTYVIVTHDENFIADARRDHENGHFNGRPRLTWGSDWVEFVSGSGPIRIKVRYLQPSNRDKDLAAVVDIVRSLRASG